jgi:hypothetical protein
VPDGNVFQNLDMEKSIYVRKMMVEVILKTDMAVHFNLASEFKQRVESREAGAEENPTDLKGQLMFCIVHVVDIGTGTAEFDVFDGWGMRCVQEFQD